MVAPTPSSHYPEPAKAAVRFAPAMLFTVVMMAAGCASITPTADQGAAASVAATPTSAPTPSVAEVKPPPDPQQVGEARLAEGIALYDKGDFNGAIKLLQGSPEIWTTSVNTRLQAYKYEAFSHCLSNRRPACRYSFDELLKLNPAFTLSAAEAGHPMWGPVFKQAKREAAVHASASQGSPNQRAQGKRAADTRADNSVAKSGVDKDRR